MKTDRAHREIKRFRELQGRKGIWSQHWEDLARVQLPRRMGFASAQIDGARRTTDIFDGTPMMAARGLANAVAAQNRPEGQDYFSLTVDNDELSEREEAKVWLADTEDRLREAMESPPARMRQATGEVDLDLVVFGTGILFIGERESLDRLLYSSIHLKDASVLFSDEGEPIGIYRSRRYTLQQAADRFGEQNLSGEIRKKLSENKFDDRIEILHAVVKRPDGREDAFLSRNLPFTNLWIEIEEEWEIGDGGFHEFPFVVPRWDTSSGEDYGRSPGMIALPDANTLQAMGETILVAGQRTADPPLMVPNDGSFDAVNTFPGGLSSYDVETAREVGGNPFFPLETGRNLPITRDMQMDTREQIFRAFFRNVLNLPIDGPEMTATEIIARKEEFIREIGPVFGRLETDYTAPMIERSFKVVLRGGGFARIPDILAGGRVVFEYESPVVRIRKQIEAQVAQLWVAEALKISEVRPEAGDRVNVDEYLKFTADAGGVPHRIVNSDEVTQANAQSRLEAQQNAETMAVLQEGAEAANKGSQALERVLPEQAA